MIKIQNNKFILETIGVSIPIVDGFLIGDETDYETISFMPIDKDCVITFSAESTYDVDGFLVGDETDCETISFMPIEKDCVITFSAESTYDVDGKIGLNKKLEEQKDNISVINEQPAEIEINGLKGYCATFFHWTRQVYEIHFDAINNNEATLVVTVAIDCSRAEEDSEWYNMSDEERCVKAYEKIKKILDRKNIKDYINGIEIVK